MKRILLILFMAVWTSMLSAKGISDEGRARAWCDSTALQRIEGIWEFPDDETRVLIKRVIPTARIYDIIVLSSPDCRLIPGDRIGEVRPTAEAGTYRLSICRSRVKGILTDPGHCEAKLKDNEASLTFKPRKISFKLGSIYFLPKFWRTIRFRFNDPEGDIPDGMIRVYPPAPAAKSSEPVYL